MRIIDRQATGAHIRSYMDVNGMETKDLAKELGISFQAVSKFLKGKNLPTINHLLHMSDLFRTTVDELLVVDKKMLKKNAAISSCKVPRKDII